MTPVDALISKTALELQREFDSSFNRLPVSQNGEFVSLLAIRAGSNPYAVRLSAIAALHVDKHIVALPDAARELLGIAGFRGAIVPVYSLGLLLGHPVAGRSRWVALTRTIPVALAFEHLDAYLHVPKAAIVRSTEVGFPQRRVGDVVVHEGLVRPVVDVESILNSITSRGRPTSPQKE
jgi:purine-binding chemotaxis protein CheW